MSKLLEALLARLMFLNARPAFWRERALLIGQAYRWVYSGRVMFIDERRWDILALRPEWLWGLAPLL